MLSNVTSDVYDDATDDLPASIIITSGKYTGVIYRIGPVSADNETGKLSFKYDVLDSAGLNIVHSEMTKLIGDSIVDSITFSLKTD